MRLQRSNQQRNALTRTEVLVIVVVVAVIAVMILPSIGSKVRKRVQRILCVDNLKQITVAFREQGDKYPMQVSTNSGGAMELVATGNVAAVFQVMSNNLFTPKRLICPADADHHAATDFAAGFGNANISYFVGLDADDGHLESVVAGDDNFEIGGIPVKSGVLQIFTNTPIAWRGERHKNWGNFNLADGWVCWTNTAGLTNALIQHCKTANTGDTIRLAIP